MSGWLDIEVPRNGDYFQEWQLFDSEGVPLNLSGEVIEMAAQAAAGDGRVIARAAVNVVEPMAGRFTVHWRGSDFANFGDTRALSRAAYDMKRKFGDDKTEVPVRGHLLIIPEATP